MDSNLSNKAKAGTRAQRKTRTKNRGSQTCSSSDDDFHSDDNLRPYEEVKVAYHDKKLTGLGKCWLSCVCSAVVVYTCSALAVSSELFQFYLFLYFAE